MGFLEDAIKVFDLDEGVRYMPYKDTAGFWTIGRGHLIGASLSQLALSDLIVDELFKEDLGRAIREARLVVGDVFFDEMSPARQIALISMLFTLGKTKFLKFEATIEAMKNHDWEAVSRHIMDSKWARDVDPKQREGIGRDDRIAYMFKNGEFHPDYKVDS